MAAYNKTILTNAGLQLLGDALTGDEIEFVSLSIGSGNYTAEEKKTDSIRNMTSLKTCQQTVFFSLIKRVEDNQVLLKANLSNDNLKNGYLMTEIGIMARKKGTEDAILYSVITTEESDYFPCAEDGRYSIIFNINVNIGDVENVSIVFQKETYALAEDLADTNESLKNLAEKNENHIADKDNPHSVTKTQVGLGNVDNTADTDKPVSTAQATAIADAKKAGTDAQNNIDTHTKNTTIHITADERNNWNAKASKYGWIATIKGQTWSRILQLRTSIPVIGTSGILNVSFTRAGVVSNATFMIVTSHKNKCNITQVNSSGLSSFKIRGVADTNGFAYIELYDYAGGITADTEQKVYCEFIPLRMNSISTYTEFTDGTTIPSGFTANDALTVSIGSTVASKFVGDLVGNADTATKLATARTINGTSFDGSADIRTANSWNYSFGQNETTAEYRTFAKMPKINTNYNCGATFLVTDGGDFGNTHTGAWLVQISNRDSVPSMYVRVLEPSNHIVFGCWSDDDYYYFGAKCVRYSAGLYITVLSRRDLSVAIGKISTSTTQPSNWTEVDFLYTPQPSASDTTAGIMKLYNESGENTDGAMTQATTALKSFYGDTTINVGRKTGTTVGAYSTAEGNNTTASGDYSHSEGQATTASGDYSHSEGLSTTASGNRSHAEGYITTARGSYSHAEGNNTTASGDQSHAEGYGTTASGNNSHAEGNGTTASGNSSHAEGYNTTALAHQHAQGHYNDTSLAKANGSSGTSTGTAFVIGNGTSDATSNAFRVTGEGETYAKMAYNSTGADYAEFAEWADGNTDNEDRRGYFVTFDEEKTNMIRKANEGDYILGIVSGNPCIIGNSDESWLGRYVFDEFGSIVYEEIDCEETYVDEETGEEKTRTVKGTFYKQNQDYDPEREYVHRKYRQEWDYVGWLGVLSVRDDNTCIPGGYCKVADGGIATSCERCVDTYRVLERVTDNVIKVALK